MIAALLLIVGYGVAIFFPLPEDMAAKVKEPVNKAVAFVKEETVKREAENAETAAKDGVGALQKGAGQAQAEDGSDSEQQSGEEDDKEYFTQADLMRSSTGTGKTTLYLGTFPTKSAADEAIKALSLGKLDALTFDFKSPTNKKVTLVTIGQFDDKGSAYHEKLRLEDKHDINLQIVKFPEKEEEKDEKEELVKQLVEAISGDKNNQTEEQPKETQTNK